jgi:hypothetical protein
MNKSNKELSPIVLFTYNRLKHTKKTIEALQANYLAMESDLIIFSDGHKNEVDKDDVLIVRNYIKTVGGFKSVKIVLRDKNFGLANSIISGVTQVVNEFGRVIVLEDDIVTNKSFLKFMNSALDFYENQKNIYHITGWNYPVKINSCKDSFVWRVMNCWGWATWSDRWLFYRKDVDAAINNSSVADVNKFNLDGYVDFFRQITLNKEGILNTWAVFWYWSIFNRGGLCVNPTKSFVSNIGFDGSGTNCPRSMIGVDYFDSTDFFDKEFLFEDVLEENRGIVKAIKKYLTRKRFLVFLNSTRLKFINLFLKFFNKNKKI